MDFEELSKKYLCEFTAADAGVGSTAEGEYNSDDTYAPGDNRIPHVLGTTITRDLSSGKAKRKKKTKTRKLTESTAVTVYRGVTKHGNTNLGKQSKSIQDKLVGALGPNYTDSEEIGNIFKRGAGAGGELLQKSAQGRVLELQDYADVIRLYAQFQSSMTPGLVNNIKNSTGDEQFSYIQQAAGELREILKKNYDWIKVPFAVSDAAYFSQKGLEGLIYIDLNA